MDLRFLNGALTRHQVAHSTSIPACCVSSGSSRIVFVDGAANPEHSSCDGLNARELAIMKRVGSRTNSLAALDYSDQPPFENSGPRGSPSATALMRNIRAPQVALQATK